jgi:hypothetical protein
LIQNKKEVVEEGERSEEEKENTGIFVGKEDKTN